MNTLDFKQGKISYSHSGKGNTVVLLHGFLENLSYWKPLQERLQKKFRVIAIDLPGHGGSSSFGYAHSMEFMADVVAAVLKTHRVRKCSIVGHSMGGYVGLAFAKKHSENLRSLVLLNSTAFADSTQKKADRLKAINAVKENHSVFIVNAIPNLFAEGNRIVLAKEIEQIKKEALKTPTQGIVACLEGMRERPDSLSVLKDSSIKKLIITGEKDTVIPIETIREQAQLMKNGQLITLPNSGHMSLSEEKDEVINALEKFL